MSVAAPWPVFGVFDEASCDWIAVDVAELFYEPRLSEDVEVVVAVLPELWTLALESA